MADLLALKTLGQLAQTGYKTKSIKDELRDNLISKLQSGENVFEGIWGYEHTVIPEIEKAILSKHNINLLGLRGQAKTRIARTMVKLLDEYIPYIAESEIYDDPFQPISTFGKNLFAEKGNDLPIEWLHYTERYAEKLATPDVSVADLIGDIDPIKANSLKLSYSDERVIHFGLIPRSNRCIFVINELPDLQARIQVSLFNILQEGDIQIRGFKLRLPLDIQFVFTANPEDYTNRGSIVTPLKDRIESQIITHYPKDIATGKQITKQEAKPKGLQSEIYVNEILKNLVEQVAIEARKSEYVDPKSGVSARMTISAYENILSSAELRTIKNKAKYSFARVSDLYATLSAINGKIELVYEGELEGPAIVAQKLISQAIRAEFELYFPNPESDKKRKNTVSKYKKITDWFSNGNMVDLMVNDDDKTYKEKLDKVDGLLELVKEAFNVSKDQDKYFLMEFALHGLAEFSQISKQAVDEGIEFGDLLQSMLGGDSPF
jgi:magnesium chelatase subunit I